MLASHSLLAAGCLFSRLLLSPLLIPLLKHPSPAPLSSQHVSFHTSIPKLEFPFIRTSPCLPTQTALSVGRRKRKMQWHSVVRGFFLIVALFVSLTSSFKPLLRQGGTRHASTACFAGARSLHNEFTVEKATPALMEELNVKSWDQWSTADSPKYKVGVRSPLKTCTYLSLCHHLQSMRLLK